MSQSNDGLVREGRESRGGRGCGRGDPVGQCTQGYLEYDENEESEAEAGVSVLLDLVRSREGARREGRTKKCWPFTWA